MTDTGPVEPSVLPSPLAGARNSAWYGMKLTAVVDASMCTVNDY